ncbi:MAG: PIN domain-containing protein [Anaerolineales bacterium]|nr:PIN domain-containing protein [Anaerolineales bacterium]
MSALMLDTSAYAAFKRGHPDAVDALRKARSILIPAIVMGELLAGFEVGSNRQKNRTELTEFQRSPRVNTVGIMGETAERYAHIYAYLREIGSPIPTNDLWIAASAMEHSAELLTFDDHFQNIPQIIVRSFG